MNKNVNMARLQKPELFPEKITPHCLRHFNASVLINNDVDVKTVQGCLGHSCASTTLNIYAHSFQDIEKLKSMAEGIEQQQTMILKQWELMEDIKNAINELINDKNHIDVYLKMLPHKWSFTVAKGVMVALETLKKAEASENSISEASLP